MLVGHREIFSDFLFEFLPGLLPKPTGSALCWDDPQIRAELDAYYGRLYGLTRDELRYTPSGVDRKEVHGEDFPGETYRVLKEKEIKQFGDALRRTRRLASAASGGMG